MSQTGYAPIQLYRTATASAAPVAGNLAFGELALNYNDGKLYYKNSAGVVTLLASKDAAAGAFTTLSASSTVSGVGFSNYLASPPAIGGTTAAAITGTTITATAAFSGPHNGTVGATTPSTGSFTTLAASSTVSGTGFSNYLASPPAIGGTAPAAGNFTTLAASSTLAVGGIPVGGYSFTSRSTGLSNANFIDTDAGASGMNIVFLKNSASPAASDDIANLRFFGNNSIAGQTEYARLAATIESPANTSEDGMLSLYTVKAGTIAERVRYSTANGLYVLNGAFRCPDAYAFNVGATFRSAYINSAGQFGGLTSSIRYKENIEESAYGLDELMQLRSVTFNYKSDPTFARSLGFIAEEVDAIGLRELVSYNEENKPETVHYELMTALLTKAIQEQQAMIEDLKARVAALGG